MISFSVAALEIISRVSIFLFPEVFGKAFEDWMINSILLMVVLMGMSFWLAVSLLNRAASWQEKTGPEFTALAGATVITLRLAYEISMSAFASTLSTFSQYVVTATSNYEQNALFLTFLCVFYGAVYVRMKYHDFAVYL